MQIFKGNTHNRIHKKIKQLTCGIGLGLLALSPLSHADFSSAMVDYEAKKFPAAMEEFKRLASLGHKDSQFNLGVMHFRGEGLEINPVEAYAWLALSASDGDANRAHMRDVVAKRLDAKQKEQAFKRADELLVQMSDNALKAKLMPVLLSDVDCKFNLKPKKMVTPQYPTAMQQQGLSGSVDVDYTVDKLGFVRDYSVIATTNAGFTQESFEALKKWRYEPTYISGQPVEVVVKQIRMNYRMNGVIWDKKKIKEYIDSLRAKAETGTTSDMYSFAYVTSLISELRVQRKESNEWFLKAAQAGLPRAQYEIGKSLFRGEGCEVDTQKAIEWLTLAAQDNSPDAQYFLGVSLLGSDQFQQNKKQAIEWLNHAVAGKNPKAAMRLSWILSTDDDDAYRDAKKSLALVTEVYENYPDKFRANENLAAAQAANGMFDEAIKSQKLAIKLAKKIDYPLDALNNRLMIYQQNQPLREKM